MSLACVLVLSCGRGGTQVGYVLPCIREMIADTSSVGHSVLEDYDPEMNGGLNYPLTKQMVFGVNLSF